MYKVTLILLFILYSCFYPDIDTVPEFISLNISMEEKLDKCKINNTFKTSELKKDCFKDYRDIIKRL